MAEVERSLQLSGRGELRAFGQEGDADVRAQYVAFVVLLVLAIGSRSYAKPQVSPPSARLVDTVWKMLEEKYTNV